MRPASPQRETPNSTGCCRSTSRTTSPGQRQPLSPPARAAAAGLSLSAQRSCGPWNTRRSLTEPSARPREGHAAHRSPYAAPLRGCNRVRHARTGHQPLRAIAGISGRRCASSHGARCRVPGIPDPRVRRFSAARTPRFLRGGFFRGSGVWGERKQGARRLSHTELTENRVSCPAVGAGSCGAGTWIERRVRSQAPARHTALVIRRASRSMPARSAVPPPR